MDLEDFFGSQTAIAVGLTAAVLSPRARKVLRRGAVYGVAGALVAGDAVSAAARGTRRGVQQAAATAGGASQGSAERAGGDGDA
ncbi:MAG: hypothetical protein H0V53_14255 [Rubrobacter sp.]|nr:hypothetical protein [Rubrobacter sp.]